jgi:hypothetical protein
LFALVAALVIGTGCNDSGPEAPPNLLDPAKPPQVISTYPPDGGLGPFEVYLSGTSDKPHFIVQWNKLLDLRSFDPNWLRIEGFPSSVFARLYAPVQLNEVAAFSLFEADTYRPAVYAIGHTYAVTVETTLVDATGRHPDATYRFSFVPEPYFRVAGVEFERGEPVEPLSRILLRFNAPTDPNASAGFQFTPPVAGTWLPGFDGMGFVFNHDQPFDFSSVCVLEVPATTADRDGHTLRGPFTRSFSVQGFKIRDTYPHDGDSTASLDGGISVAVNAPIDTASVRAAFHIEPAVSGSFSSFFGGFTFEPDLQLPALAHYTVTIGTELRATDGTHLAAPYGFDFTTDAFRIYDTQPFFGQSNVAVGDSIVVRCNANLDPATAPDAIMIEPSVQGVYRFGFPPSWYFAFVPSQPLAQATEYRVTISTRLHSLGGSPLQQSYFFSFTTAATNADLSARQPSTVDRANRIKSSNR